MSHQKLLFTPGPLTTSETVKQAMLRDMGSRDAEFLSVVTHIRRRLLELGHVANGSYEAVLMQGSGTFAVESVLSSVIPSSGKLLVAINGAYGHRMAKITTVLGISCQTIVGEEDRPVPVERVRRVLAEDPAITHVAVVHCETSTGMLNPVVELGSIVRELGRIFIVDAMSSFGGIPIDISEAKIDFLVSSANKCLQGVPGFAFVLARRDLLEGNEGNARSVSLDLVAQWRELEHSGQFQFTPPTHALLAFQQALEELQEEGGVEARAARYSANRRALIEGMTELGFDAYLRPEHQSHFITSFRLPAHRRFDFPTFYRRLSELGFVIYPGKVSNVECFRIGTIGHIFPQDLRALVAAIRQALGGMQVDLRDPVLGSRERAIPRSQP
ncbi:MAG TPA: 2-aminoethylphosphonate--pyruvate transaminase [Terriglobales bacterium]|nr:2-aminoethylphosphonate--pyruvate transaminase [Terriglobales bacterium]